MIVISCNMNFFNLQWAFCLYQYMQCTGRKHLKLHNTSNNNHTTSQQPASSPDMVLTSASSKQVLLKELTVPWEDCVEENEGKQGGGSARTCCREVRCRCFAGRSLCKVLQSSWCQEIRKLKLESPKISPISFKEVAGEI